MKTILYSFVFAFLFSCGNEKTVLLPEISHSEITEIQDVSAGYLFYNETEKDSVELNRKNLISTTNWLINVDKRLTLKQVIPHIKYLQEKKQNSSHKNKDAKNYFTCNDTSRKDLGFIELPKSYFYNDGSGYDVGKNSFHANLMFFSLEDIRLITSDNKVFLTNESSLIKTINDSLNSNKCLIFLEFEEGLTFQEYINIKSAISKLDSKKIIISNNEFIFN
ncbi:MAG: hypothetical protein ABJK28_02335 [Algibacter sp.]